MSHIIEGIRDRPGRVRRVTLRWTLVYVSAGAVLLEVLDVFSLRLGLPDRFFVLAAIALVLLLPGVAGAGALRGLSEEDDERPRPPQASGRPEVATSSIPRSGRETRVPAPDDPLPSGADMAELHYRLGRYYEDRGDSRRAAHHYARSFHCEEGNSPGANSPTRRPESP
jgi:hypothetical protein